MLTQWCKKIERDDMVLYGEAANLESGTGVRVVCCMMRGSTSSIPLSRYVMIALSHH